MKKIISILLSVVMILSCVSVMSFATVTDAVAKIEFKVKDITDDIVTFEVWLEQSDEIGLLGAFDALYIGYDSRVFETVDTLTDGVRLNWVDQTTVITEGYPCDNNFMKGTSGSIMRNPSNISVNATDLARGWDTILWFNMPPDCADDDYHTAAAMLAFKLKLKADAPADGCYNVGVCDASITGDCQTILNEELAGFGGNDSASLGFNAPVVFELVEATVNVTPAATSIIKNGGNQIRFRGVGIDGNFSAYQNKFDVRTVAKISAADFKAKFGATDAEALEKIKDIGFVFAPMSETFEMDAAIALAKKDTTGQVSEGIYTKKPCKYIGHESDNADYIFTCIVENIEDTTANRANGFTCLAYACDVDGNYYFFDAAATADYQALFTAYFKG